METAANVLGQGAKRTGQIALKTFFNFLAQMGCIHRMYALHWVRAIKPSEEIKNDQV